MRIFEICFIEKAERYVHVKAKSKKHAEKKFMSGDVDLGNAFDYGDFGKDEIKSIRTVDKGEWRVG